MSGKNRFTSVAGAAAGLFAMAAIGYAQGVPNPRMHIAYPPTDAKVVDGNGTSLPVVDGMPIQDGYTLVNGRRALMEVSIDGVGRILLDWGAVVKINVGMAPKPAKRFFQYTLTLEKGWVYCDLRGMTMNESSLTLNSKGVSMKVTGTTFAAEQRRGVTTVIVADGRVDVWRSSETWGTRQKVLAGQQIVIDPRNAVGLPTSVSNRNQKYLSELNDLF